MSSNTATNISNTVNNAASDATGGSVGNPTLVHQATHLASSGVSLAKNVIGAGGVQDANITAGAVINETRDLAASVIGTTRSVVRSVIVGGTEKAQDVAGDVADSAKSQQPVGYVASARNTVGNVVDKVLGTAESIIATAAHKIDSATPGGTSSDSTIQGSLNSAAQGTKDAFKADAQTGQSAFANAASDAYSKVADTAASVDKKTGASGYLKTAAGAVGRQTDIATDKVKSS